MGRITTPKYRLELSGYNYPAGSTQRLDGAQAWDMHYGKASTANIEKYVMGQTQSFMLGGVNEHVSKSMGFVPMPSRGRIVNQKTGTVVAEWKASMFQVMPESPSGVAKKAIKRITRKHKTGTTLGSMR